MTSDDEPADQTTSREDPQSGTAFRDGRRVTRDAPATGDAGTDPYSDFTVPQDADMTADAPAQTSPSRSGTDAHDDTVTEDPSGRSGEVEDDPSASAATPADAEEIQPESPA